MGHELIPHEQERSRMTLGWQSHDDGSAPTTMFEVMADVASIESTQPEVALGAFRSLAEQASFPYRHFAREQCAVILWKLGRRDEALWILRRDRQLIGDAGEPDPTYARACHIILRMADAVGPNRERGFDEQVVQRLEEARTICERHGDLIMVAKVNRLKARFRSRDPQPRGAGVLGPVGV
jgi:hypothetical protein